MPAIIYLSEHCPPCIEVSRLIKAGKLTEDAEIVSIDTDEGFDRFTRDILQHGDGAVPSAYKEGKRCKILIDDEENLHLDCPQDAPPSLPPE